jgi:hypothetical protein
MWQLQRNSFSVEWPSASQQRPPCYLIFVFRSLLQIFHGTFMYFVSRTICVNLYVSITQLFSRWKWIVVCFLTVDSLNQILARAIRMHSSPDLHPKLPKTTLKLYPTRSNLSAIAIRQRHARPIQIHPITTK